MSTETNETTTPEQPAPTRDITVSIPADRVEDFERLVARFQRAGERPHGRCRRGPRGRGRHIHVHLHG